MKNGLSLLAFAGLIIGAACAPATKTTSEAVAGPLKPDVIQWGASAADIEAALGGQCANGFVNRPIDPPFLPDVQDKQVQIDCDGFEFLGAPRWTEFVIGDDRLQMVWVMVDASDEAKTVAALTEAYGEPSSRNEHFIAFMDGNAAWRFEPAEVLFYADEVEDWLAPWLKGEHAE